jgi:phage protein U
LSSAGNSSNFTPEIRLKRKTMLNEKNERKAALQFSGTASYRIVIQGKLDEHWAGKFGSMTICVQDVNRVNMQSILEGEIADQAQLSGILNTLYEMHLPIISLELISNKGKK